MMTLENITYAYLCIIDTVASDMIFVIIFFLIHYLGQCIKI